MAANSRSEARAALGAPLVDSQATEDAIAALGKTGADALSKAAKQGRLEVADVVDWSDRLRRLVS